MNNGCIEAIGSHEELMKTSQVYQEIYTSQNRAHSTDTQEKEVEVLMPMPRHGGTPLPKGQRKDVLLRLIKMLFQFYPVMLPITLLCILANAIISSIPSVFMQNIIALVEQSYQSGGLGRGFRPGAALLWAFWWCCTPSA